MSVNLFELFFSANNPSHASIPQVKMAQCPKTNKLGGKMYNGKYNLLNYTLRWNAATPRIYLWPFRRDDGSGVLIDAGGTLRSDWSACA